MTKTILALGASLLAFGAVTAEAETFGHVAGTVNYVDQDFFGSGNIDVWKYGIDGAIGFDVNPSWNVQFDAAYRGDSYQSGGFFSGYDFDSYRAGTQIFWRDAAKGMAGVEVAYQSLNAYGNTVDGFLVGLKGEYYMPSTTIGGGLTYSQFDGVFGYQTSDTFGGNLFATYYASDAIAVSLRTSYANTDLDVSNSSQGLWKIGADVEYLFIPSMSVGANIGYTSNDYFNSGTYDAFNVGVKLKFYFGSEGTTLSSIHRTSTLESAVTDLDLLPLD